MPKIEATPITRWKCAGHEIGIVHRQIERRLAQHQTGDAAGDEERNKADRK